MKKIFSLALASVMALSLAACSDSGAQGGSSEGESSEGESSATVANNEKPLIWYNRQPSNSSTGALDMDALTFNKNTYYVGFDANQGAELQGEMIAKYIEEHKDTIDRNGDGIIGYVLCIGDIGHNDSIARTRGARKALGTAVEVDGAIDSAPIEVNKDGSSTHVQDGELAGLKVRELASHEMKSAAGATWDAATAGDTVSAWVGDFGDQIDVVVSNNDGMGMAVFNKWSKEAGIPTFGYDANSDAVAAIADGFGGTISQHADVQAYLTLRVMRNILDGVDIMTGIATPDDAGNVLTDTDYKYSEADRSFYALNLAVTADNYQDFLDATAIYAPISNQLDEAAHPTKKIWINTYNASDNFLSSTYNPQLKNYAQTLNLSGVDDMIGGDGQSESSVSNKLANPSEYDGFAINMIKTDNAATYTSILNQ